MNNFLTSQHNGNLAAQLEDVRHCLADLAKRGGLIVGVHLAGKSVPLIHLAYPPHGIKGGTIRIKGEASKRTETYAARHMDCQIEWRVEA